MIKYTSLLLGLMVKFSPMVFYLFGPPVFIYSVVRFRSLDPVFWKLIFVGFIIILAGCVNSVVRFRSNGLAFSKMTEDHRAFIALCCGSFQMCVSIDDSGSFQMNAAQTAPSPC